MNAIIEAAFSRTRLVIMMLVAMLVIGAYSYVNIPKESAPEVRIPIIYVVTTLDGISPGDSERLLVKPLETELATLAGLKKIESSAGEGYASVTMEFDPGYDPELAYQKVQEAVDKAEGDLPTDATKPSVNEINTSLFPILTAILSGSIPERTLNQIANDLEDRIEGVNGVLEVDVNGDRTELMEVIIDPTVFETYKLSFNELITQITRNNRLIAAGAIEGGAGRVVLKVPGLIESTQDVLSMPIKVRGNQVVTFADIATVRRTYEAPTSFARINGRTALSLEVKKRTGANIIATVERVKAAIKEAEKDWPESVEISFTQDESQQVKDLLSDLEANVISAIILVMLVIIWALGSRSSILVGLSIPGAFLVGVTAVWALGYTMNIVVLFSLILVVGMLVDGAIVTTELADRKLEEGLKPKDAYAYAAKRMAWPIIASTVTTLSVFLPLLFWEGTTGEFMKYLPITVLLTLSASLVMALVFIPVLGGLIGKRQPQSARNKAALYAAEHGDPREISGFTGGYVRVLQQAVLHPVVTLMIAMIMLIGSFIAYGKLGAGVTFFPSVEPDFLQVEIRARDNFSIYERDALVRIVEDRLIAYDDVKSVYAKSMVEGRSDPEMIGSIQLELKDWDTRRKADVISAQIREQMQDIAGVDVQVQKPANGPSQGKPISLKLLANDRELQLTLVEQIREQMQELGGFTDVTDTLPLPGVEWTLRVNRSEAARFGADISLLGQTVQLLTQGIEVADYRPDDADGAVDIRVRFPAGERTLAELESLRVPTSKGLVPIANFVEFVPAPRSGTIKRYDQKRVVAIEANAAPGILVNDLINKLKAALASMDLPDQVTWTFGGEAEEQAAAGRFLSLAFLTAISLMFAILVTQFNSFYQAIIVMSAIVFSIGGVLLGLMVTGRPFGVVMGGIGVISLAGIVVNNNIVLIDTYNDLLKEGQSPLEAILRTGAQRLRPVVLTSVTTALGLMPMVIGLNIDFFKRTIVYGAPSTQWWTELSSAIAGGLVIATILTLVVTPAMLMIGVRKKHRNTPLYPTKDHSPMSVVRQA